MQRKIPVKTLAILLRVDNNRQMVSAPCLPHNDSWARVLSSHKSNSFNCHPLTMSPNESLLDDLFPISSVQCRNRAPKRLVIMYRPRRWVWIKEIDTADVLGEERAFLEIQGREEAMNFFFFAWYEAFLESDAPVLKGAAQFRLKSLHLITWARSSANIHSDKWIHVAQTAREKTRKKTGTVAKMQILWMRRRSRC